MPSETYGSPARTARRTVAVVTAIALVGIAAGIGSWAVRPGPPDPGLRTYGDCAELAAETGFGAAPVRADPLEPQVIAERDPGDGGQDAVRSAVRGATLVTLDLRHDRRGPTRHRGAVHVVDVGRAQPVLRGRLDLPPGERATGLFPLGPDRAVVLGHRRGRDAATVLTLLDVGGPGAPRVLRRSETAGTSLGAWRYGGRVRVATATASGLPTHTVTDGAGTVLAAAPLLRCTDLRGPRDAGATGLVGVVDLALDGPNPLSGGPAAGVLVDSADVLLAGGRTYVTTTLTGDGGSWTAVHAFAGGRHVATGSLPGLRTGPWTRSPTGLLQVVTDPVPVRPADRAAGERLTLLAERDGRLVPAGPPMEVYGSGPVAAISWVGGLADVTTTGDQPSVESFDLRDPARPRRMGGVNAPAPHSPLELVERLLAGEPVTTVHPGWRQARAEAPAAYPGRRLTILLDWVRRKGRIVDVVLAVRADRDRRLCVTGRYAGSPDIVAVLRAGPRLVALTPHAVVTLDPGALQVIATMAVVNSPRTGDFPPAGRRHSGDRPARSCTA